MKECSDNYNLVYLKLGAKAGAVTFPDVGFKSPKGALVILHLTSSSMLA